MEIMKKIAKRHGLECLLHEKPFARVNGSGKHNNWSIKTDTGVNLFDPGETPQENAQFLIFLTAVIKAVDDYQDLVRISISSAGNDHRLGGSEAPPAIVSIFLGDELTEILESIENDAEYVNRRQNQMLIGVHTIPAFPADNTDRNRTSPFAFTGNKFEFRMPGASASISTPNTILNTIVAEALKQFADQLENAADLNAAVHDLIQRTFREHKRIIFNGNGYDAAWIREAKNRGLSNYASTPEAFAHYLDPKNIRVFSENGVMSETEYRSRYEIYLEKYTKTVNIEALTMIDMLKKDILPSIRQFEKLMADSLISDRQLGVFDEDSYETVVFGKIKQLEKSIFVNLRNLEMSLTPHPHQSALTIAFYYHDEIIPLMEVIRKDVDELELITDRTYWPMPTYLELMFGVD